MCMPDSTYVILATSLQSVATVAIEIVWHYKVANYLFTDTLQG